MKEKIYCGSGKAIQTKYGEVITISFSPNDLKTLLENKNEKGWVNLNLSERKEIGKYGETHSVTINNWKPSQSDNRSKKSTNDSIPIEDIPF